jgi:hypothetical protein
VVVAITGMMQQLTLRVQLLHPRNQSRIDN